MVVPLLVFPWLNPFSIGPTPAVMSLVLSWACALLASMVLCGAQGDRHVKGVTAAWLTAASVSGLLGVLQYFDATAMFGTWVSSPAIGEAYANLRQRNQFATLLNMGLASLLWWMALVMRAGVAHVHLLKYALLAGAVLLALANAASSSRTGLVQLVLVICITLGWSKGMEAPVRKELKRVLLLTAVAYGMAILVLPVLAGFDLYSKGMLARLQQGDSVLCASRLTLWSNVLHLIGQKPWLGWGWGELDYAHFITLYPGARFCELLDNAHNLPLHLAVELGVPVAMAVCVIVVWLVWRAQPWRETDATRQMAWLVLALIAVHSLLEYPLWYGPFQVAVALCVWLLWRRPAATLARRTAPKALLQRALAMSAAAAALVFFSYAAWDYWRISQIYLPVESRSRNYQTHTLEKIRGSWLFRDQVLFAELTTTTTITPANAAHTYALAQELLHFSPEPRVVEKLIESATMLGRDDDALFYLQRFKAAFPEQHARWRATLKLPQ